MHPNPRKEPPEMTFSTNGVLKTAVETLWLHADPADSGYERGVIGLVAHLAFEGDWSAAQTAVYDERERMEQDIAEEIDAAKANLEDAGRRLVAAEEKRPPKRS